MNSRFVRNIYKNETNGYCVSRFVSTEEEIPEAARKHTVAGYEFTATGYGLPETDSLEVDLQGRWIRYRGLLQLSVESFSEILPQTLEGIEQYLSSGIIKGVGPKTAKLIVKQFGLRTFEIMEQYPDKLKEVRGITDKKMDAILSSFQGSRILRDLAVYLMPYQISMKKIQKIYQKFGTDAVDVVKNQPFALCSVSGFGFITVDQIARATNCRLNDPMRIEGAILYVMEQKMTEGHLYLEQENYEKWVYECLNHGFIQEVVSLREIRQSFFKMANDHTLSMEGNAIYRDDVLRMEQNTARNIAALLLQKTSDYKVDLLLDQAQKELGIMLSENQAAAVRMVFENMLSIITGGPGTGKTTVEKVILYIDKKLGGGKVMLMAPTGRASRRMAESTGMEEASTMHSALGLTGDDDECCNAEALDAQLLLADEYSMVDMKLADCFFSRIKKGTRCVLIGDMDQLASVGPGNVFSELIKSDVVPITKLDLVFRQGANSRIASNAKLMLQNSAQFDYGTDFVFIPAENDQETQKLLQEIYQQEISDNGIEGVQILTALRKKSQVCANTLNDLLHESINPADVRKAVMKANGKVFRVGDKVIQNRNKDGISNGDTGYITDIFQDEDQVLIARIDFNGIVMEYDEDAMAVVEHAYAITIHKSQGSEYPVVIIPWLNLFYMMLQRNVLYTAVTRAKKKVIIIGQKQAVYRAVHNTSSSKRNTKLGERLARSYYEKAGRQKETYEQIAMNF